MSLLNHYLENNKEVEVCFCDTSASVVYSYISKIKADTEGFFTEHEYNIRKDYIKDFDGCYVFMCDPITKKKL